MARVRRRFWQIGALLAGLGVLAGGWAAMYAADRRFQAELADARQALVDGRPGTARKALATLSERRPRHGETLYLRGLAEQMLGHPDQAIKLWRRVVESESNEAGLAALHIARQLQADGDLTGAEIAYRDEALTRPGAHEPIARWDYVRLLRLEGRFDEAIRCFREGLPTHPEPIEGMRLLLKLETDPYPVEMARAQFQECLRRKPVEPRAWLGLANAALQSGQLDEAHSWLSRCLETDSDDPSVWRSWLDWARAAGHAEEVRRALDHLPGTPDLETEILALTMRAWLARDAGDQESERAALVALDEKTQGQPETLDRLAQIALEDGLEQDAARYRSRRADRERAREQYIALLLAPDLPDRLDELSAQAEALGRDFEAMAWKALESRETSTADVLAAVVRDYYPPAGATTLAALVNAPSAWLVASPAFDADSNRPLVIPRFEDAGFSSGLSAFVHQTGHIDGRLALPETMGGGVAILDFDGDGWFDVFAVQGGSFPPRADAPNADRLFRNLGNGTFEDVSEAAGLREVPGSYGHGVTAGDYDNDGHPDLFITRWRSYQLLRNRGDGTFEDATQAAGLAGDRDWPTSAAFADLDHDGDLDLYVCHYLAWDEFNDRTCFDPDRPGEYNCKPLDFPALSDHLFRNDAGRFVDVSQEAGIVDTQGRGLGVLAADLDGDREVELYVANDMTADYLWRRSGPWRYDETGLLAGVACNATGGYQAGMGTGCGDLDGDGRLDLFVTNYHAESTTFFRNLGDGYFADQSAAIGLAAPSRDRLGFGIVPFDANNDGRLDLLTANGHVYDGRPNYPWKMRPQLLVGSAPSRVRDVTDEAGEPFGRLILGRGLATGDLDHDGRVDAVMVAQDEPLIHLHNTTENPGHFVSIQLVGTRSNRDGIGATVVVEAGGRRQVAARIGGGSYQSSSDPRLHFGLGASDRADSIEVRWPSGQVDRYEDVPADQFLVVQEGDREPRLQRSAERPINPGTNP